MKWSVQEANPTHFEPVISIFNRINLPVRACCIRLQHLVLDVVSAIEEAVTDGIDVTALSPSLSNSHRRRSYTIFGKEGKKLRVCLFYFQNVRCALRSVSPSIFWGAF